MKIDLYSVVKKFCNTEKSSSLLTHGVVTVFVDKMTHKQQIMRAFEVVFEVKPKNVRLLNTPHKNRRFRGKEGTSLGLKKAFVNVGVGNTSKFSKTA